MLKHNGAEQLEHSVHAEQFDWQMESEEWADVAIYSLKKRQKHEENLRKVNEGEASPAVRQSKLERRRELGAGGFCRRSHYGGGSRDCRLERRRRSWQHLCAYHIIQTQTHKRVFVNVNK